MNGPNGRDAANGQRHADASSTTHPEAGLFQIGLNTQCNVTGWNNMQRIRGPWAPWGRHPHWVRISIHPGKAKQKLSLLGVTEWAVSAA